VREQSGIDFDFGRYYGKNGLIIEEFYTLPVEQIKRSVDDINAKFFDSIAFAKKRSNNHTTLK